MNPPKLIERPAFDVAGRKIWISGQDNQLFGRFWEVCRAEGLFAEFDRLGGWRPGPQTGGVTLGVSCVADDPACREFYYLIAIEKPPVALSDTLETYRVPAALWAVFECIGKVPDSIVEAEIYAFTQWLPASGCEHASAPEMEVYPEGESGEDYRCEFWLPVRARQAIRRFSCLAC
jgi:AraC family transcriptional regulator